jgi:hypothetical protein
MKLITVLALFLVAASSFASEFNTNKCESELNQNALRCQKMRQFCGRMGPAESLPFELCMDDVYVCIVEGRDAYKACLDKEATNK